MVKAQECLNMLRSIKDVAFATVDEHGSPQVRIIDIMIVGEEKLYFVAPRGKNFHKEVVHRGEVGVSGMTRDWQMIRLTGKVKKVDASWLDKVFEQNVSMNMIYPNKSRLILDVFCIYRGSGEYYSLNEQPIFRQPFAFGGDVLPKKGFVITEQCGLCGICAASCPQQCIEAGEFRYEIQQYHCLHCGLCAEQCPRHAVKKREETDAV